MNAKLNRGIFLIVLLPLVAGCAENPGIVRGQSPGGMPASHWSAAASAQSIHPAACHGHTGFAPHLGCPNCGKQPYGGLRPMPPIEMRRPLQHVLSHGNNHSGAGRGHHPTHYHWFSYEQPRDLVYPPANQPSAVIQYPYYTLKGPDDFFLQ